MPCDKVLTWKLHENVKYKIDYRIVWLCWLVWIACQEKYITFTSCLKEQILALVSPSSTSFLTSRHSRNKTASSHSSASSCRRVQWPHAAQGRKWNDIWNLYNSLFLMYQNQINFGNSFHIISITLSAYRPCNSVRLRWHVIIFPKSKGVIFVLTKFVRNCNFKRKESIYQFS